MRKQHGRTALALLLAVGLLGGCASAKVNKEGRDMTRLNREQIINAGGNNMHDVISRLRPQWLNAPAATSFSMNNVVVVFQDNMNMGGPTALRQISPEGIYEARYMDGQRAAATLPGITNGQHIEGAIILSTKPPSN